MRTGPQWPPPRGLSPWGICVGPNPPDIYNSSALHISCRQRRGVCLECSTLSSPQIDVETPYRKNTVKSFPEKLSKIRFMNNPRHLNATHIVPRFGSATMDHNLRTPTQLLPHIRHGCCQGPDPDAVQHVPRDGQLDGPESRSGNCGPRCPNTPRGGGGLVHWSGIHRRIYSLSTTIHIVQHMHLYRRYMLQALFPDIAFLHFIGFF